MTATIAAGFGGGNAIELPAIGTLVGAGLVAFVIAHASGGISARRPDPAT